MTFETQAHGCKLALIYCRVSSKKQSKMGDGLNSQQTRCEQYAQFKGYNIIKVFKDDVSGRYRHRPGMEQMFSFLKAQKKEQYVILIDDISRIARDIRVHLDLRDAIDKVGAILESPSLEFKNDPDSIYFENMQAINAQHHRLKNAKQTRDRMHSRLISGYWCFQSPVGYIHRDIKGHGKLLVRDEPLATIIQDGLEGFASERFQTQAELVRYFQSFDKFPKDKYGKVRNQRVKEILQRSIYAGYLEAPTWEISLRKAKHKGLISLVTFRKIQTRLNGGDIKAASRKDINADFPLRGAIQCECKTPYTACWSKGKNKKYAYYLCHNRTCEYYKKSIPRERIESEFANLLNGLQPSYHLFKIASDMLKDVWDYHKNNSIRVVDDARLERVKIEEQIQHFLDRIIETNSQSVISAYEQKILKLETDKLVCQEKLEYLGKPRHAFEKMFEHALVFLSNPQKLWGYDKLEHKRMVLKFVFLDRLTYIKNQGFRTPNLSIPFSALSGFSRDEMEMARFGGESSNEIFDILGDWNEQIIAEDIDIKGFG